jgi:hypothetical protein
MAAFPRNAFVGLASLTSANGTTRTGLALPLNKVGKSGLVVECITALTTSAVTAQFTPQVSNDNVNWFDLRPLNAPANVITATGTGSPVTTRTALIIDQSAAAYLFFRCNALLAGAATAGADQTQVNYRWQQNDF